LGLAGTSDFSLCLVVWGCCFVYDVLLVVRFLVPSVSQFVQRLNGVRRRVLLLGVLLLLIVSAVLQLGEGRQKVTSRAVLPDGTSGRVALDQFLCAQDPDGSFINIDFLAAWTDATRAKSHSTLVHMGKTETNGIRLDLGESSSTGDRKYYYLIVGSADEAAGYRVETFPLTELDNRDVQVSLLVTHQAYSLTLRTNSGTVFQSRGASVTVDCRAIYVGGGPPGVVPGFTDVALYSSETFNSRLIIEQGEFRIVSRIGLPDSIFIIAQWLYRAALVAIVLLMAVLVRRWWLWRGELVTHIAKKNVGLILFSLPFFILAFASIIYVIHFGLFERIFGFDYQGAIGEWIQFICYIVASVIGVATWRLLKKSGFKKENVLIALFSIACFFIGLEEISYGQWIFKWEAPALFLEINAQSETNLHNINGTITHWLFMAVGFWGSFGWIYKRIRKGGLLTDLVCADWHYSSYFFPVLAWYFNYDFTRFFFPIENYQELFEFILSFGFVLVSISNYLNVVRLIALKPTSPA